MNNKNFVSWIIMSDNTQMMYFNVCDHNELSDKTPSLISFAEGMNVVVSLLLL